MGTGFPALRPAKVQRGAFELDIGLIEGACPEPALAVTPWMQDELVIVAAPTHELLGRAHRARGAHAVPSKQLRSAVWLVREQGSGTRQATDMALLPHLHSYTRQIEFGSTEAIKHAAAANLGLTCLSRLAVADWLDSGRIVEVPTTLPRLRRQCYIVTHHSKQVTATMSGFKALALALPVA